MHFIYEQQASKRSQTQKKKRKCFRVGGGWRLGGLEWNTWIYDQRDRFFLAFSSLLSLSLSLSLCIIFLWKNGSSTSVSRWKRCVEKMRAHAHAHTHTHTHSRARTHAYTRTHHQQQHHNNNNTTPPAEETTVEEWCARVES